MTEFTGLEDVIGGIHADMQNAAGRIATLNSGLTAESQRAAAAETALDAAKQPLMPSSALRLSTGAAGSSTIIATATITAAVNASSTANPASETATTLVISQADWDANEVFNITHEATGCQLYFYKGNIPPFIGCAGKDGNVYQAVVNSSTRTITFTKVNTTLEWTKVFEDNYDNLASSTQLPSIDITNKTEVLLRWDYQPKGEPEFGGQVHIPLTIFNNLTTSLTRQMYSGCLSDALGSLGSDSSYFWSIVAKKTSATQLVIGNDNATPYILDIKDMSNRTIAWYKQQASAFRFKVWVR